ncbi:MAG TPA: hypothetical protein VGL77_02670, partial [Armatimonadota bacterium]
SSAFLCGVECILYIVYKIGEKSSFTVGMSGELTKALATLPGGKSNTIWKGVNSTVWNPTGIALSLPTVPPRTCIPAVC